MIRSTVRINLQKFDFRLIKRLENVCGFIEVDTIEIDI